MRCCCYCGKCGDKKIAPVIVSLVLFYRCLGALLRFKLIGKRFRQYRQFHPVDEELKFFLPAKEFLGGKVTIGYIKELFSKRVL